jgi:hypothetical protein
MVMCLSALPRHAPTMQWLADAEVDLSLWHGLAPTSLVFNQHVHASHCHIYIACTHRMHAGEVTAHPQPKSCLLRPEFMRHVLMPAVANSRKMSSSMAPTRYLLRTGHVRGR